MGALECAAFSLTGDVARSQLLYRAVNVYARPPEDHIPQRLLGQLKAGGKMVLPLGRRTIKSSS
jgi:protein-L-isoaspartate O-methyltransferase